MKPLPTILLLLALASCSRSITVHPGDALLMKHRSTVLIADTLIAGKWYAHNNSYNGGITLNAVRKNLTTETKLIKPWAH